ncbi:uncharacterized protein LOC128343441 isoform X2 [Hemicordylus capensis]|uniref:uncharacterized protein LOC128343441 isoform X2 n=1 Tax=Hemicordylus capensis TaxID=884348 RepID=UPI002303B471|nr:uncharacterized protein LOC128343441 isoform X2 [Hemicordylus capensis]
MAPGKGTHWREEEVDMLLGLLQESEMVERVMSSTPLPSLSIFEGIARIMADAGFNRTAAQVRSKFKRIKATFFEALERFQGHPPPRHRPPHYDEMWILWEAAGRPSRLSCHPEAAYRGKERKRYMCRVEEEEYEEEHEQELLVDGEIHGMALRSWHRPQHAEEEEKPAQPVSREPDGEQPSTSTAGQRTNSHHMGHFMEVSTQTELWSNSETQTEASEDDLLTAVKRIERRMLSICRGKCWETPLCA